MKSFLTFLFTPFLFNSFSLADKPSVVFFIADDVSQEDFGCYGHPVIQTPNVDALAKQGMRFDNAYLTTSSCSPTRCSIITGRYPHNTGAPELQSACPRNKSVSRAPAGSRLLHRAFRKEPHVRKQGPGL